MITTQAPGRSCGCRYGKRWSRRIDPRSWRQCHAGTWDTYYYFSCHYCVFNYDYDYYLFHCDYHHIIIGNKFAPCAPAGPGTHITILVVIIIFLIMIMIIIFNIVIIIILSSVICLPLYTGGTWNTYYYLSCHYYLRTI